MAICVAHSAAGFGWVGLVWDGMVWFGMGWYGLGWDGGTIWHTVVTLFAG